MMDPGSLRQALQPAPDAPDGYDTAEQLDVQLIMTRGKRLRLRRRAAAAGGVLCVAAAVFGIVTGAAGTNGSAPVPAQRLAPANRLPSVPAPSPVPRRATPLPPGAETPSPSPTGHGAASPTPGLATPGLATTGAATPTANPARAQGPINPSPTASR